MVFLLLFHVRLVSINMSDEFAYVSEGCKIDCGRFIVRDDLVGKKVRAIIRWLGWTCLIQLRLSSPLIMKRSCHVRPRTLMCMGCFHCSDY